jgi:hypothetical protein
MSATHKKAAMLEQWLVNHRACYPAPSFAFTDDNLFAHASCSCGEDFEMTVVVDVVPKVIRK